MFSAHVAYQIIEGGRALVNFAGIQFALCGRPPVVGLSFRTSGPCRAATL